MSCNEWRETELGLIPMDWDIKAIGEIGKVVGGGTPNTKEYKYWDGDISWITPKDLSGYNERYIYKGERSITMEGLENSSARLLPKGTVLFSSRAPIGYVAIAGQELATNQGFKSIICNDEIAYNIFVYYLMKYKKNEIEQIANGSTFKEVSGKVLSEFKVVLPPLHEQKAIAKILSDLDEKIEINNRINKVLEEIAQTIFKRWFVDFEFPNENGEPYKSSGGEMVDSELGPIPKGWEVGKLGESKITEILSSGIEEFDDEKIYLATADVEGTKIINRTTKITYKEKPSRANMQPRVSTIWFAKMKNSKKIILVDDFSEDIINNYIFSTGFAGIKCLDSSLYYLWCFISNDRFEDIKNSLCNGTTMQAINNENINKINILIPERNLMIDFYNKVKSIYKTIYRLEEQNQTLSQLRDTLLPKLMSGQIRVDLNNGEVVMKDNED